MKISELKLNKIRKEINVDIDGEVKKITIFNVLDEKRGEIISFMQELLEGKDELNDADVEEIFNMLFPICTDIELDEDIVDIVNNPSTEMVIVLNEILNIYNELYLEILYGQLRQLNGIELALTSKYLLLKSQKIELLGKDCYSLEKELNDEERIRHRLKILEEKYQAEKDIEMENQENNE